MFKKIILILAIGLAVVGCSSDPSSTTDLREYNVDGYLSFVGVGTWDNETFHITDYRGVKHDIPAGAVILEGPISLESFERARMRITNQ
jgi:hypothetical protein